MYKKLTAMTLLLIMLLQGTGIWVSSKEINSEEANTVVALGILEPTVEDYISRAEIVKGLLNLLGMTEYAGNSNLTFLDLDSGDAEFPMFSTAVSLSLIKGGQDGRVRPYEYATYLEGIIMLLRATGYDTLAEEFGGSASDYYLIASRYGFLKGITYSSDYITFQDMAKLIYNSFDIGIVEQVSFSDEKRNYIIDKEKTTLSYLNIKKGSGVITETGLSSLYYTGTPTSENSVVINNQQLKVGETNGTDLLGYNVEYYYSSKEENENTLLYLFPKENEILTLEFTPNMFYMKDNELYYSENDREIKIDISPKSILLMNGIAREFDYDLITNNELTGSITFIDNKDNQIPNAYKVISILGFQNDVVDSIDSDEKRIYLANTIYKGKPYIEIPESENAQIQVYKNGEAIRYLEDIKRDDVISFILEENLLKLYVSDKVVEGIPQEIITEDETTIQIDNVKYKVLPFAINQHLISTTAKLKFYLDYQNNVAKVTAALDKNYGYVLKASLLGSFESRGVVKILTAVGTVKTYEMEEKVLMVRTNSRLDGESVVNALKNEKNNLIVYELNNKGEIKSIEIAKPPAGEAGETESTFILSHTYSGTDVKGYNVLDGIGIKGTLLFNIYQSLETGEPVEEFCSVDSFNSSVSYNNMKFYDVGESGVAKSAIVITKISTQGSGQIIEGTFANHPTEICVFNKVVSAIKEDGTSGKKIYYYNKGVLKSVFLADSLKQIKSKIAARTVSSFVNIDIPIYNLKVGDVFIYTKNIKNELDSYLVYYVDELYQDKDGIFFLGGSGVLPMSLEFQVLKGKLKYKDEQIFNITTLNIKDQITGYPFVLGNNLAVTFVERGSGKIKKSSLSGAPIGSTVLVIGGRDVLSEVIVYE